MMPSHAARYPAYTYSAGQWPQQLPHQYPQWGYQHPQYMPYSGGPPGGNPYPSYSYPSPNLKKKKEKRPRSLSPPPDVELHQLLGGRYRPTTFWDVTQDLPNARHISQHGTLEVIPKGMLSAPATEPPAHFMKIVCDAFPWDIIIDVPRGEDVSVGHVLGAIYGTLQEPLEKEEWQEETNNCRKRMYKAMCTRIAKDPPRYKVDGHVRRVDYLMEKTHFLGLKPVGPPDAPEEWLLKLGPPPKRK